MIDHPQGWFALIVALAEWVRRIVDVSGHGLPVLTLEELNLMFQWLSRTVAKVLQLLFDCIDQILGGIRVEKYLHSVIIIVIHTKLISTS